MANGILFFTRPGKKAEIPIYVRARIDGKDYMSRIPDTTTTAEDWPDGRHAQKQIRTFFPVLGTIATAIEESINNGTFSKVQMDALIDTAVYGESREQARAKIAKAREEKKRLSVLGYYAKFLQELRDGVRKSDKGVQASERTITNYKQGYNRLDDFQKASGEEITWESIDRDFLARYIQFLQGPGRGLDAYNTNTCAKRVKEIKHIVRAARLDGVTNCPVPEFKFGETAVDSIYLTAEEISRFASADITYKLDEDGKIALDKEEKPIKLSKGHETARDIFLIGCYTGQRVSDYANIKRDQIWTGKDGRTYISIVQKKTGKRVVVHARPELCALLEKYNYNLPQLEDQVINRYIKEIAHCAGINEMIEQVSTKGGKTTRVKQPKYKLVTSHTARRSFATNAYLDGWNSIDIMKYTGHSSEKMLLKYIKSTPEDDARRIAEKYAK